MSWILVSSVCVCAHVYVHACVHVCFRSSVSINNLHYFIVML